MRALITGGAGFIGSSLADRLLADGHSVLVIDNFATGQRENLTWRPGLAVVEAAVEDMGAWAWTVEDFSPDVVVHAAASYKNPDAWDVDARTNVTGTVNTVRAAQAAGCGRFIYFQTALCYGTTPSEQPVTLDHPVRPDSSYAISKTAGEQYLRMSGLDFVSLRLANCYGPRNLSGPLPTFYRRLTAGEPVFVMDTRRDFVFIDDLLDIVLRAVDGEGHGIYHVSTGRDHAIKDLYQQVAREFGVDGDVPVTPRTEDDAPTILLDPSRTLEDFPGWAAKTTLRDGVSRAVEYYRTSGVRETYTHLKIPA